MTRMFEYPAINMGLLGVCFTVAYTTQTMGALIGTALTAVLTITSMIGGDNASSR